MSDQIRAYRGQVMQACRDAAKRQHTKELLANDSGLSFTLVLWFETKDESRWLAPHTNVPDLDNVTKLFQDVAVDAGLVERGDGRIAHLQVIKAWNKDAGALVRVSPIGVADMHLFMNQMTGAFDG